MGGVNKSLVAVMLAGLAVSPLARAEEVVLGAPLSMTGTYGYIGPDVLNGMQLAVSEVNARHEAGAGRTLRLVTGDDGSERAQAITLVNRMVAEDDALAIVGPNSTVTALAAAPVANDRQIPLLAIAVSSAVTRAGPWSYHVMVPPGLLMTALAAYVVDHLHPKTVMTVHGRDNEGAVAQIRAARDYLQGKTTLLPEESALMSETNFSALATKIADQKPDVVIIAMADANAASLIAQCVEAGVERSTVFVGNNATASPSFLRIGGAAVEGTYMAADAFPQARKDPVATTFMHDYQERYKAAPSQWSAIGYTMIHVVARAMASVPGPLSRDALRTAMGQVQGLETVLGQGPFGFDAQREPSYQPVILTVRNGAFQVAPGAAQ